VTADVLLRGRVEHGVATITIDHPPTNLVDGAFLTALVGLLDACDRDDSLRVVVFTSADPDFFLMHGDVEAILAAPSRAPARVAEPNRAAVTFDRLRTARYVTIAAIDGAARGGGAEFCSAVDLRFGTPRTVFGQPEVPMGILPGAGGTARLPRLLGRSRALDVMLTGRDVDADDALEMGWLDALEPSDELLARVAVLARRLAAMPPESIAAVKQVVDVSLESGLAPALVAESAELARLMGLGTHREPMRRFLDVGGQTRDGETQRMRAIVDATIAGEIDDADDDGR
jgi:enoyl-CoA hydratase/carnithine racemase